MGAGVRSVLAAAHRLLSVRMTKIENRVESVSVEYTMSTRLVGGGVAKVTTFVLEHGPECKGSAGFGFVAGTSARYKLAPICSGRCDVRIIGRMLGRATEAGRR